MSADRGQKRPSVDARVDQEDRAREKRVGWQAIGCGTLFGLGGTVLAAPVGFVFAMAGGDAPHFWLWVVGGTAWGASLGVVSFCLYSRRIARRCAWIFGLAVGWTVGIGFFFSCINRTDFLPDAVCQIAAQWCATGLFVGLVISAVVLRPVGRRWGWWGRILAWALASLLCAVPIVGMALRTATFDPTQVLRGLRAVARLQTPPAVTSVAFSPDGKILAVGTTTFSIFSEPTESQAAVTLWDMESLTRRVALPFPIGVNSVAISPDGEKLAVACGTVSYYGPSGGYVGSQGEVQLWDLATVEKIGSFSDERGAFGVAFSPDGSVLAVLLAGVPADSAEVRLCDAATLRQRGTVPCSFGEHVPLQSYSAPRLAFSPDGMVLAVAEQLIGDGRIVPRVRLWRVEADYLTSEFAALPMGSTLAFSPDGKTLAVGADVIQLWDVTSEPRLAGRVPSGPSEVMAFSPNGELLAFGGSMLPGDFGGTLGTAGVWTVADPTERAALGLMQLDTGIRAIAFSPDGNTLVTGSENGLICLWALEER